MNKSRTLYNKYTPKFFHEVIGQKIIVNILNNIITRGSIPNAILFSGLYGTGKTSLARIFARAINCIDDNKPCGKCLNCIDDSIIQELDGATHNGVGDIKELLENIFYLPLRNVLYKIYIIDEVHMLSRSAFDSMLMTLQDPPSHVVFLFSTTNYMKIPDTFLSRCIHLQLRSLNNYDMKKYLDFILEEEKIELNDYIKDELIDYSEGSLRKLLSSIDPISLLNDKQDIFSFLEILTKDQCLEIFLLCLEGKPQKAIDKWIEYYSKGYNERSFLNNICKILTDLTLQPDHFIKTKYNIDNNFLLQCWDITSNQIANLITHCPRVIETTLIMYSSVKTK